MRTLKLARIVFMIVILGSLLIGPLNMFVYCSPIEGTVPFNCPNVPPPMHEVDLNLKFLSLFAENIVSIHQKRYDVSKLMGTIDGVYFRGYADSVGSFAQTIYYYEKTLVENGWDTLVKIRTHDERIQIHALVISQTIAGLFVMAGDETQTQLVNIVGRIEPERLGEIFENLKAIELEIPQLQLN